MVKGFWNSLQRWFVVGVAGSLLLLSPLSQATEVNALWVAQDATSGVRKIATDTGTSLFNISNSYDVQSVGVDPTNTRTWAVTQSKLYSYQFDGSQLTSTSLPDYDDGGGMGGGGHGGGGGGHGHNHNQWLLDVDTDTGEVWVTIDHHVHKYNGQGQLQNEWEISSDAKAIAIDESRNWVWLATSSSVKAYQTSNFSQVKSLSLGSYPSVKDIAIDTTLDEVWVTNNGKLQRYAPDSGSQTFSQSFSGIDYVDADGQGFAWVTVNSTLKHINTSGSVLQSLTPISGYNLNHLVADPNDHSVWVASSYKIKHVDIQGQIPHTVNLGDAINDLAIYSYVDDEPPVLSFVLPLDGSFHNTNQLALQFTATDIGDGIDATSLVLQANSVTVPTSCTLNGSTLDCTLTGTLTEGANNLTATVQDLAGNTSQPTSITITVDTVAPSITANVSPAANAAGWHNSDVTVTFTCNDTGSGIASCPSPVVVSTEGAGQVVDGTATDNAGNTASTSVTINLDKTLPTITASVTPVANAAGWHNSDVTVSFTCNDTGSGIASCPSPVVVTTEGANQVVTGTVTDNADNSASVSVTLNIDKTPPSITTGVTQLPNAAGWNNADITSTFVCLDDLSGIASCSDPIVTTEGANQSVTGTAVDIAGNESTDSFVLNIDTSLPQITATPTPAANAAGWNNTDVTVNFTCSDTVSGIASCSDPATVSTEGANQDVIGTALDVAENTASTTITLNIDKTAPVITISTPADGATVTDELLTVAGTVIDTNTISSFTINGTGVTLNPDASFSTSITLVEGLNTITASATDIADNIGSHVISVTYEATPYPPVITTTPVTHVPELTTYTYDVDATDQNVSDVLTYSLDQAPIGSSINAQSGVIDWPDTTGYVQSNGLLNTACVGSQQGALNLTLKWQWHDNGVTTSSDQVLGPVVVGQLNDDNGDGAINTLDIPDLVFLSWTPNLLHAVSGVDGSTLWTTSDGALGRYNSVALADIDGDGLVEIVLVANNRNTLLAYENDGTLKWSMPTNYPVGKSDPRDAIAFADIDRDGTPEIIHGRQVYNNDGTVRWTGVNDNGGSNYGFISIAADVDNSGAMEVVAGRSLYDVNGNTLWHRNDISGDGFNAVGNFDSDNFAEIVLVASGNVYLLEHTSETIWGPVAIPGGGAGGAPTVADFDGDGELEIGVAGANNYAVIETDGSLKWSSPTFDNSSHRTGSSLFDFEQDGRSEVLYSDERNFYIYDGATGETLVSIPNGSATTFEYPIVADIDNDGQAEIIIAGNSVNYPGNKGVRVFESGGAPWPGTRSIWNQHSYHITNINDDGTVPQIEQSSWLTHNTYRLNAFLDQPLNANPDLRVSDVSIQDTGTDLTLSAVAMNRGLLLVGQPTPVNFYNGDPNTGGVLLGTTQVNPIDSGEQQSVSITGVAYSSVTTDLYVTVDEANNVLECVENNNTVRAAVIKARVADPGELFDTQIFAINVDDMNEAPTIISNPTTSTLENGSYEYQVEVSDNDIGDGHTYALVSTLAGMEIDEYTGLLTWYPSSSFIGNNEITIEVTDLSGATAQQTYTLVVGANTPPEITTQPPTSADESVLYQYDVDATDINGDTISYSLSVLPTGMTIDSTTGLIQWTPGATQGGLNDVVVLAGDGRGGFASQAFSINVIASNNPPTITTTPITTGNIDALYTYNVDATDADGDALTFGLDAAPVGMSIDPVSGSIQWMPGQGQLGEHTVVVRVTDQPGYAATQSYQLTVGASSNVPPTITSTPVYNAAVDTLYTYDVEATDVNAGDILTYSFSSAVPSGMTIDAATGLIQWTPTIDQLGAQTISVTVTDNYGLAAIQTYTVITGSSNTAPYLTRDPVFLAIAGIQFSNQIYATDPDGDALIYSLVNPSAGLTINATTGELSWLPGLNQVDQHTVTVQVDDGKYQGQLIQDITINVIDPVALPSGLLDHRGTDFWLTFLTNLGQPITPLYVSSDVQATGTIEIVSTGTVIPFSVNPGELVPISLPYADVSVRAVGNVENYGVHVTSDQEITVYGNNHDTYTTDAFLALPTDVVGTDYLVMSYEVNGSQYAIVATQDNTNVTIIPSVDWLRLVDGQVMPAGNPVNVTLNQGQTYAIQGQATTGSDFTGTIITADKNVAVFGGHTCADVPNGTGFCDHLVEQLPPINSWGTSYFTMPLATKGNGDTFRILASNDNTSVSINGVPQTVLNANDFYETILTEPSHITSTEAVLVAQFSNGNQFDNPPPGEPNPYPYGDPFMMLVPPAGQYLSNYIVTTPDEGFVANYINLIAADSALSSVTLDGMDVPVTDFVSIPGTGYSGAQIPVSMGTHHVESDSAIGVFVYGFNVDDSYGYPAGMALSPINDVSALDLSPATSTHPQNTEACFDATVTDVNTNPLASVRVDFSVTGVNSASGFAYSNSSGLAQFCYRGDIVGTDSIEARVVDITTVVTHDWTASLTQSPVITSSPVLSVTQGQLYTYSVLATDPDGDPLTYSLDQMAPGMTVDSVSGVITWSVPNLVAYVGDYNVTVRAEDGLGGVDTQSYVLTVQPSSTNSYPTITSTPLLSIVVGDTYTYDVDATDPDADTVTFSLLTAPVGMTIDPATGVITWIPTAGQVGVNTVDVKAEDPFGNFSTQAFGLSVADPTNQGPTITSIPAITAKSGYAFSDTVIATDPESDPLTYSLITAPTGMTINQTGLITWSPVSNDIGAHTVTVRVNDAGHYIEQTWTLTVLDGALALQANLTMEPESIQPGEVTTITVTSENAAGATTRSLTINGTPYALDANGQIQFTSYTYGPHTVEATVSDQYDTASTTAQLYVVDPNDVTPPFVDISAPGSDITITTPIDISGAVSDDNLHSYTLVYAPKGTYNYTVLAQGTTSFPNQIIAQLDPSLMMNGLYDVILQAADLNGNVTAADIVVKVEGDLKVGNFSFTVTDLEIPVSGIPIRVTRTYDSRRRDESLDFGYGWSVGYQDVKMEESRIPGYGWALNTYGTGPFGIIPLYCVEPLGQPTVSVTLPDGRVETFDVAAENPCWEGTPVLDHTLAFNAQSGTLSTLESISYAGGRLINGNLADVGTFEPVNPDQYRLTTKEGFVYNLDQSFGITSVVDPNGNTLTYTNDGIYHSDGKSVLFTRDASGQIIEVVDPMGNIIQYQRDANGDLESVTDAATNVTQYTYNSNHGLLDIIDPLGRNIIRNIYDANGRLIAQEDSNGNRTDFNHDIAGRTSTVTDRLGRVTFFGYDDRGNVTSKIDPAGNTWGYTYDADDNQLTQTDPLGNVTGATYNDRRDQLTQTDALGNTVSFSYNQRGQELTVVDARGNTFNNTYDVVGNLLTISGPLGNVAGQNIDAKGQVTLRQDVLGNDTTFTYDGEGNKLTETDPLGNTTTYTYDANGNVFTETRSRLVGGVPVNEITSYTYDAQNRVISTTDALGNTTQVEYDAVGNETARIDANGNRTEMEYDAYRRLTRTVYPDLTEETKVYDVEGNLTGETDRLGRTTSYSYDALNRQTQVTYPDGTTTQTEYDAAGRVTAEIDANGNRTEHVYDAAGRRTLTRDALLNETTFSYDADGNLLTTTDANGNSMTYEYDALDRRTRTVFANASDSLEGFDALGRVTSKTDQAGLATQYEYDALGRLTAVVDALSQRTEYSYDEVGNKLTQTDANGHTTSWTYDASGRVLTRTLPLGQVESFAYDANGNQTSHTDFNGNTTNFEYDNNNRLTRKVYSDLTEDTYTYDAVGNRLTATDSNGTTTYAYDDRNRLTLETKPDGTTLAYTYDNAGNRTSVVTTLPTSPTPTVETTSYGYDVLNRLQTVTDNSLNVTSYTYDNVGNRTSITYPNGNVTTYSYDSLNRLTDQETRDATTAVINSYSYTLSASGRRTQVIEQSGATTSYSYDDLYRLTGEDLTSHPVLGSVSNSYIYDAVGNRTSGIENGVSTAYTYDANDRLLTAGGETYSYDANGNTLTVAIDADLTTNTYNASNRLIGMVKTVSGTPVDDVSYQYDIDGIRTAKNDDGVITSYIVDKNRDYAQVLNEIDASANPQVSYVYGDDLIKQTRAANDSYYLYDGLGSTRALTDATGTITDTYDYSAYGAEIDSTGITENSYKYTGEQFDQNLDNYYLRARYYDPSNGRFTQQDTWMGNDSDPVTLHKYIYAGNDPVLMVDPSGNNFTLGAQMAAIGGFAILVGNAQYSSQIGGSLAGSWDSDGLSSTQAGWLAIAAMGGVGSKIVDLIQKKVDAREEEGRRVTLYHGTSRNAARKIMRKGFRDAPVFFAEDRVTAHFFGRARAAANGSVNVAVLTFSVPMSVINASGMKRGVIGDELGLGFVDVPGGSGYEWIIINNLGLQVFNGSLLTGATTVR